MHKIVPSLFCSFSYLPHLYSPLSLSTSPLDKCTVSGLFGSIQITLFFCIHCACVPPQSGVCLPQSYPQSQASRVVGPPCSAMTEIIISLTPLLGVLVVHHYKSSDLFLTMPPVPPVLVTCLLLAQHPH